MTRPKIEQGKLAAVAAQDLLFYIFLSVAFSLTMRTTALVPNTIDDVTKHRRDVECAVRTVQGDDVARYGV